MRRSLIALFATLSLAGCGDGEGTGTAFIRASFDGKMWSAEAQEGTVVYGVGSPDSGGTIWTLARRPYGGGSQFIALNLPMTPTIGTHPLNGSTALATFASCPNDVVGDCIYWSAVAEHPGTLIIDRIDPVDGLIEGSFVFNGYALGNPEGPSKSFTAGRFRIYAPSVFILE